VLEACLASASYNMPRPRNVISRMMMMMMIELAASHLYM